MQKSISFEWKSAVEPAFIGRGELLVVDNDAAIRAVFTAASKIPLLFSDSRQYGMSVCCAGDRITLTTINNDIPQMICTVVRGCTMTRGWYACVRPMDCGTMTFANNEAILELFTIFSA